MRVLHAFLAAVFGALLLGGALAQAPHAQLPMKTPVPPKTGMMQRASVQPRAKRMAPRITVSPQLQLRSRIFVPAPALYYSGQVYANPYLANVNPYAAPGAINGAPSYPASGYGNYPMPYGGYGAGANTGNGGAGYGPSGYTPPASTAASTTQDVYLYDNCFKPSLTVVAVGGTVQWMNEGRHHHTVTSNSEQWDSGELNPRGGSYSVTFTEPGVYYYFCAMHPHEMRGMVQVMNSGGASESGSSSGSGAGSGY